MRMPVLFLASMVLGGSLAGCSVKYGCPAPNGVTCRPISEVYSRSLSGKEPQADTSSGKTKNKKDSPAKAAIPVPEPPPGLPPKSPSPIRSAPQILRVWITPWIDAEGDLHQEGYLFVVVDPGRWAMGLPEIEPQSVPKQVIAPDGQGGGKIEPQRPSGQQEFPQTPNGSGTNGKD
jgi:conjugal transfer pilus assembly protein TraV